MQGYVAVFEK